MRAGQRSRTADAAAALRASHSLSDSDPIFDDVFAIELTSPGYRRLVGNPTLHWFYRLGVGLIRPVLGEILARQRYAEDRLALALELGVTRYVILAAGLDSFALRRPDLAHALEIVEIDHPASQAAKRRRLANLGLEPKNVTYVPIDFEKESLAETMAAHGLTAETAAFVSWLGTTYYLTKQAVFATFAAVGRSLAAGSEVVFDYLDEAPFGDGPKSSVVKRLFWFDARMGEPLITGLEDEELVKELLKIGFEVIETLTPEEQEERYFARRTDGLTPFEHGRFCCARVM